MIRYTIVTIRDDALDSRNKIRREDEGIAYNSHVIREVLWHPIGSHHWTNSTPMRLLQRKKDRRPRVAA